jgi:broad specificity phosphatase PhoE
VVRTIQAGCGLKLQPAFSIPFSRRNQQVIARMTQVIWLTRHGNRQDFVDPAWVDTAERPFDPGLSLDGIEQAKKMALRLQGEAIKYVFASPYLRTVQTAHYVADLLDLTLYLEPGLGEWLNPNWFPEEPRRLSMRLLTDLFPRIDPKYTPVCIPEYPETVDQALERAGETVRRLSQAYVGTSLMVGHGASVTGGAIGLVPDLGPTECALCSLFKAIRHDSVWKMELCGDVSHLGHSEAAFRFN